MTSNLDVSQDVHQNYIPVVILPVGRMPENKFRLYSAEVKAICRVEIGSLTFHSAHSESPLREMDWGRGSICFRFFDNGSPRKSHWEHFQVHKRVVAVICLCHCPSCPDLSVAYDEFVAVKKTFPQAIGFKCYAFEPMDSQVDLLERQDFMMFPNQDIGHLRFYLTTMFTDFASHLLESFQQTIKTLQKGFSRPSPEQYPLKTPLDTEVSKSALSQVLSISKDKKVYAGRLNKHIGDFCLLAGSPADAASYYSAAVNLTKDTSDLLWQGGALEGLASCVISQDQEDAKATHAYSEKVVSLLSEAISVFHKIPNTTGLQIESILRLARYYGYFGKGREAVQLLSRAADASIDLGAQDQVAVVIECGVISLHLGMHRKYAFFLVRAAKLYDELRLYSSVCNLLLICAPIFNLKGLVETASEVASSGSLARQWERGQNQHGRWASLHLSILEQLIRCLRGTNDKCGAAAATAHLLRAMHPWLDKNSQKSLGADLFSLTRALPINVNVDLAGLPLVLAIVPVPLGADMLPIAGTVVSEEKTVDRESSDVFLFNPHDEDSQHSSVAVTYVATETFYAEVFLRNPLKFEIVVQRIALCTTGVDFEAFPESLTIPPRVHSFRVLLSGKALHPGTLRIVGCDVRAFNLSCLQTVNRLGHGALPLQADLCCDEMCPLGYHRGLGLSLDSVCDSGVQALSGTSHESSFEERNIDVASIVVVPQVPRIVLRYEFNGNSEGDLFLGEVRQISLFLQNVGKTPVSSVTLEIEEIYVLNSKESQNQYYESTVDSTSTSSVRGKSFSKGGAISWDAHSVAMQLPLAVGRTAGIPIFLRADPACTGAAITVRYSGSAVAHTLPLFYREVSETMQWRVAVGLSLKHIDVSPQLLMASPVDHPVHHVDPKPGGDTDLAMLIMEIDNSANTTFRLFVEQEDVGPSFSKSVPTRGSYVEKLCNKRVMVPVCRIPFGPDEGMLRSLALSPFGTYGLGHHLWKARANNEKLAHMYDVLQRCVEKFVRQFKFTWRSSDNTQGQLSLAARSSSYSSTESDGALSARMLALLIPEPFVFQFTLTGSTVREHQSAQPADSHFRQRFHAPVYSRSLSHFELPEQFLNRSAEATTSVLPSSRDCSAPQQTVSCEFGTKQEDDCKGPIASSVALGSTVLSSASLFNFGFVSQSVRTSAVRSPVFVRGRSQSPTSLASPERSPMATPRTPRSTSSVSHRSHHPSRSASHRGSIGGLNFETTGNLNNCYAIGEFKGIFVTITNKSSNPLELDLVVRPYQETVSGGFDADLRHKLLCVGSLTSSLPTIKPLQSYTHEQTVCFISMGRFHFQVCAIPRHQTIADQPDIVYWCNTTLVIEAVGKSRS